MVNHTGGREYRYGITLLNCRPRSYSLVVDVPDDLFRKGSIATGIMFNFLFSDLGKTYLKSTVLPMIQQVEDLTEDMVSILYHLRRHNKRSSTDFLLVLPHCNQQTFLN
jgi:hypothetical protein